jgi:hypothetical protein
MPSRCRWLPDEPGAPPPARHRGRRRAREWFSMPYMDGKERFIWGATAAMLRNFYRFLAA